MLITTLILILRRMDSAQLHAILQGKIIKYIIRILILYGFSVVFRSFDMSFTMAKSFSFLREQSFSLLFVLLGLAIWEGASFLSSFIQKKMTRKKTAPIVIALCLVMGLYGILAAITFGFAYAGFDIYLFDNYEAWESASRLSYDLIFGAFIFYLLILGSNAIIFYYKNWQEAQLNAEKLRRENIQARYDVLKSQIDPHFFFNSLSVLTNLVYKSADLSAEYITQLSKCYRYILDKKFENLVKVNTELSFLESYIFLINIRHQGSIQFVIELDAKVQETLIPPAVFQMLVENAIKHNTFSSAHPLHIYIRNDANNISIVNELRKRTGIMHSTGVGLYNICKRYELITSQKVDINESGGHFTVTLPILTKDRISNIEF